MGVKYGVDNTKDLLLFVAKFAEAISKSLSDGKIGFSDIPNFIPAMTRLLPAISGLGMIDDELMDMDQAEITELEQFAKANFDLDDDNAEAFVEKGVLLALQIADFVTDFFPVKEN